MSTNDFTPPLQAPFLGGGCYAMERAKMLVGDPTAKPIGFPLSTAHGGMLPTNFQGFTAPPVGTPNYFLNSSTPASPKPSLTSSTFLSRGLCHSGEFNPDDMGFVETLAFDGRNPAGRTDMQQPRARRGARWVERPPDARR